MMAHVTYSMGNWDVPDIYAQALGPVAFGLGYNKSGKPSCPCHKVYVIWSDKTSLITKKYTCSVYGVYQLICGCYLNIICFIQFLWIFCKYD